MRVGHGPQRGDFLGIMQVSELAPSGKLIKIRLANEARALLYIFEPDVSRLASTDKGALHAQRSIE